MKKRSPPDSAPAAVGLASQSQATQLLTKSQLHSHSLQQKQQSPPMYPWFALAPSLGQSPSPFPRYGHAVSTDANAAGELFLFGGHASMFRSNDLYVFSTRHFSTTLLQTSGETPSLYCSYGVALTSTLLLVWGGWANFSGKNVQNRVHDDSLYLLNLGMLDLLMSRPPPADQSFLRSSIAKVDPRRGQWSQAVQSFLTYRDFGWLQSLRLWWSDLWGAFK